MTMIHNQSSCAGLSIPGETRLALGVSEANRLHKYATAQAEMAALAGKNAVLAVLRLGKLLQDLKAATAHGEWGELFKKESNINLSTCAQFETQANVAHELHLNFNRQTANRYMRCYQEAMMRLDATDRAVLYMGLSGEDVAELPALVEKATGNAVTPRQMMLNLQVVKDGSKSAAQAARLAQHETILKNRGAGRAAAPVSPEQAMMAAVADVLPEEELKEQKKQVAVKDAHHIATLMAEYLEADLHKYLPGNDREAFCLLLSNFQKVIKEGK